MNVGVLVMAHGTPAEPDEIGAFYTRIRRGRPPSAEELADLERRYAAIGGVSPLAQRTAAQAAGLQRALGDGFAVRVGNKYAEPFIEDAVEELIRAGVDIVIGLVLAPHFAQRSVGEYHDRAAAAVAERAHLRTIASWHDEPALIALLAERVRAVSPREAVLIVTAHSLPLAALGDGDPYVEQVTATAALLADAVGAADHRVAWQSGGRGGMAWLEPDVRDVIAEEAAAGAVAVIVCAAGFTAEHMEVSYDLDIEARAVAEAAGVKFARTASLDDDPAFCALLADLVERSLGDVSPPPFVP